MEHPLKKVNSTISKNLNHMLFKNIKISKSYGLNSNPRSSKNVTIHYFLKNKNINEYKHFDTKLVEGKIINIDVCGQEKKIDSNHTITLPSDKIIELVITIEPPST